MAGSRFWRAGRCELIQQLHQIGVKVGQGERFSLNGLAGNFGRQRYPVWVGAAQYAETGGDVACSTEK